MMTVNQRKNPFLAIGIVLLLFILLLWLLWFFSKQNKSRVLFKPSAEEMVITPSLSPTIFPGDENDNNNDGITSENNGKDGRDGEQGLPGRQGLPGPTGIHGDRGEKGESGGQGTKGDKGDSGTAGPVGPSGPAGAQGVAGPTGLPGSNTSASFTDLTDTPNSYTGSANELVRVNSAETGLEFIDIGSISVSSLNGFTDAITIAGTSNQVTVSNGGNTITLSLPQDINTTSSPTFAGLTLSGSLTIGGDTISDFVGTGLQVSTGILSTTLGTSIDLTSEISGILPSANGGTGFSTYAQGDMLYASAVNTLAKLAIGGSGTVLTSNGTTPAWTTLGASSITADSLNFTEFTDLMSLDASTDIAVDNAEVFSITNTGSGNSFVVNDVASDSTPFVIDTSGNVSVGGNLSASGTVNFSALTASTALYTDASKNLTNIAPTSGALGYWTRTGTNLYNTTLTDNVGIGISSPGRALEVNQSFRLSHASTVLSEMNISGNAADNRIWDFRGDATGFTGNAWNDGGSVNGQWLRVTRSGTTITTTSFPTGNVSIGTNAAGARLYSFATTEQLRLAYDASNFTSFTVNSGGDLNLTPSGGDITISGTLAASGNTGIIISGASSTTTGSATTYGGSFTAASSSTSGIGFLYGINSSTTLSGSGGASNAGGARIFTQTTNLSPAWVDMLGTDITVQAGVTTNSLQGTKISLINASAATIPIMYGINIAPITNATGTITNTYGVYVGDITTGTQTNTPFSFFASDANAFNYFAGSTGIGTTTPTTFKLEVAGNIGPSIDSTGTGVGYNLGSAGRRFDTVYASNGTINTSDSRLKENVTSVDYGLDSIMQLNPVSFSWKSNPNGTRKLGLIAQELQQVIPEVVRVGDDENRTLGVYYSDLIPVVIKGIQEQQGQITAQTSGLTFLSQDVNALKAEIANKTQTEQNNNSSTNSPAPTSLTLDTLMVNNATVSGGLAVNDLNVTGKGLFTQSVEFLSAVVHKAQVTFMAPVNFFAKVVFNNDVEVLGKTTLSNTQVDKITFNKDTAGYANISKGQTSVTVMFTNPYQIAPIINISLNIDGSSPEEKKQKLTSVVKYAVTDKTTTGFTILLEKEAPDTMNFSWTALAVIDPKTAENTQQVTPTGSITPTQTTTPTPTLSITMAPTIEPTSAIIPATPSSTITP